MPCIANQSSYSLTDPKYPPLLKWVGGKRWLVPIVKPLWEACGCPRLVEPFCGGIAVALGLASPSALLNDKNIHCINFFRFIQKGTPFTLPMKNDKALFYRHRARFNALITAGAEETKEAAELFYYLNRTGYNGLCRFNQKGGFNVPFGRHLRGIAYWRDFSGYSALMKCWKFTANNFFEVPLRSTDFVYADPPYDVPFTTYTAFGFNWSDQVRLVEWLAHHKGPIVLSNQATERILKLYQEAGYQLHYLKGPRRISCTGDRTSALEVLALKNFFHPHPTIISTVTMNSPCSVLKG
ncbi:MAG: Dam family site-specific DNA-(adenine-N6)-methyltransferase [Gammaproteobacteria bacterium]|nr:Dam family site-specific DNA-(adenine-N6)-methyltransferase [Gammaproteobacteria bacterium]